MGGGGCGVVEQGAVGGVEAAGVDQSAGDVAEVEEACSCSSCRAVTEALMRSAPQQVSIARLAERERILVHTIA